MTVFLIQAEKRSRKGIGSFKNLPVLFPERARVAGGGPLMEQAAEGHPFCGDR